MSARLSNLKEGVCLVRANEGKRGRDGKKGRFNSNKTASNQPCRWLVAIASERKNSRTNLLTRNDAPAGTKQHCFLLSIKWASLQSSWEAIMHLEGLYLSQQTNKLIARAYFVRFTSIFPLYFDSFSPNQTPRSSRVHSNNILFASICEWIFLSSKKWILFIQFVKAKNSAMLRSLFTPVSLCFIWRFVGTFRLITCWNVHVCVFGKLSTARLEIIAK